jgi:hypothetical protein
VSREEHLEKLALDTHNFLAFLGRNAGSTADWPVHLQCDEDSMATLLDLMNKISTDLTSLGYSQSNPQLAP